MPDEEHPASRCDPVLAWTWHYLDLLKRAPDPSVLQDAALRALSTRAILDAGYPASDITDAWSLRLATDYFYHCPRGDREAAARNTGPVRELMHRVPTPTDAEVITFLASLLSGLERVLPRDG